LATVSCASQQVATTSSSSTAEAVPQNAVVDAVQVSVAEPIGRHAGCILRRDGTVACWGGPNILLDSQFRTEPLPGPWQVPEVGDAVQVAAGMWVDPFVRSGHCALTEQGSVYCWAGERAPTKVAIAGVKKLLANQAMHLCALTESGEVWCWGTNCNGETGAQQRPRRCHNHEPKPVPGLSGVVDASGTCALLADGSVTCWGLHPFTKDRSPSQPERVAGLPKARALVVSGDVGCIVDHSGRLLCTKHKAFALRPIEPAATLASPRKLFAGGGTICAQTRAGEIWCWGPAPVVHPTGKALEPEEARALDAHVARSYAGPARLMLGLDEAVSVSLTRSHACAVHSSGKVRCWGENRHGQLGNGTLAQPKQATFLVNHFPKLLPAPKEITFSCKASLGIRESCPALGERCELKPPPGYWNWGNRGGELCDDKCLEDSMAEVKSRPIPACMCTCSREYEQALEIENRDYGGDPPASAGD
jgi:hypothetical protein